MFENNKISHPAQSAPLAAWMGFNRNEIKIYLHKAISGSFVVCNISQASVIFSLLLLSLRPNGSNHKLLLKYLMYSFVDRSGSALFTNINPICQLLFDSINRPFRGHRRTHTQIHICTETVEQRFDDYMHRCVHTNIRLRLKACQRLSGTHRRRRNDIKFKPETEIEEKQSYRYVATSSTLRWTLARVWDSLQRSCVYSFTFTF